MNSQYTYLYIGIYYIVCLDIYNISFFFSKRVTVVLYTYLLRYSRWAYSRAGSLVR